MIRRPEWVETLDSHPEDGWVYLHFTTTWNREQLRVSIHIAEIEQQKVCWTELSYSGDFTNGNTPKYGHFEPVDSFDPYPFKDKTLEWAENELMSPMTYLAIALTKEDGDKSACGKSGEKADFLPNDKKDEQES